MNHCSKSYDFDVHRGRLLSELSDFLLLQYVTYVIIGLNEKSLNNDRNISISSIEFSMSYTMTSKSDVLNLNVVSQRFDLTVNQRTCSNPASDTGR